MAFLFGGGGGGMGGQRPPWMQQMQQQPGPQGYAGGASPPGGGPRGMMFGGQPQQPARSGWGGMGMASQMSPEQRFQEYQRQQQLRQGPGPGEQMWNQQRQQGQPYGGARMPSGGPQGLAGAGRGPGTSMLGSFLGRGMR